MKRYRIIIVITTLVAMGLLALAVFGPATGLGRIVDLKARTTLQQTSDRYALLSGVAKLRTGATDAAVAQVILEPGESIGWHTHPGPLVVLVKSGAFTLLDAHRHGCVRRVINEGESFVDSTFDGHVHNGVNEGSTPLELWVVYLLPKGAPTVVPAADPGTCG